MKSVPAFLYPSPKQRVPNQYSEGPSISGELKLWVGRSDHVPRARFPEVKKRRGRKEGMEGEDFDTSLHGV